MYYLAENLEVRRAEFVQRICNLTGCDVQAAETEVDLTLQRLFYWAAYSDKYGGTVQVVIFDEFSLLGLSLTRSPGTW